MNLWTLTIILLASAALPSAVLAQDGQKPDDPRAKKPIRQQVNLHMDEWFDEERTDGVTNAAHPYTLVAPNFTYDGACHWRRRDKDRVPPFPDPDDDDDQDEDQEDRSRPPDLTPTPRSSGITFRDVGGGIKYQFASTFGVPTIDAVSPTDSLALDFDEVDADGAPGAFFSTTLRFGDVLGLRDVEVAVFANYLGGKFTSTKSVTLLVDDGRGIGVLVPVTDAYDLQGDFWLMEVGIAPVLKRFATDDGSFSADISLAAGFYFGKLTNLEVNRTGSRVESFSLSDESLKGFFVGPAIHASYRIGGNFRIGAFAEFWRLMGDLDAWTGIGGVEVRFDF